MNELETKKHPRRRGRRGKKKRRPAPLALAIPLVASPPIPLTQVRARLALLNSRRVSGTSNAS